MGTLDIRQVQIPIVYNNSIKGYIIGAVSLKDTKMVISNLGETLLILYPVILLVLFALSRYLAGRSILPIKNITDTTNQITKNTLAERVSLPPNKDELYKLSTSINNLLNRIENALKREQQFTSDASHQLRTPLSTVQGTLEVLIRKPRTQKEYEEKIAYTLSEVDNMTETLDQLLILARLDPDKTIQNEVEMPVMQIIEPILKQNHQLIKDKNLKVHLNLSMAENSSIPSYCSHLILDNIIHNAIKYSGENGNLRVRIHEEGSKLLCTIEDDGLGINHEDLDNIFQPFFRSSALTHKNIQGNGLGLSIAKKAADTIGARIKVSSELGTGSTFTVTFLSKS
jgi:signal transduction histidine kinase